MKKSNKIITMLLLLISGCGAKHDFQGIDAELKSYVDEFIQLSAARGFGGVKNTFLTAGFEARMDGSTVASCTLFGDGSREITVDRSYWEDQNDLEKRNLMFHELTHCLCNREHNHRHGNYRSLKEEYLGPSQSWQLWEYEQHGYFTDGCPTSLMYPIMIATSCLNSHWNHYIGEMLEGCSP